MPNLYSIVSGRKGVLSDIRDKRLAPHSTDEGGFFLASATLGGLSVFVGVRNQGQTVVFSK